MKKKEIIRKINGKVDSKDIKFLIRYGDWLGNDIDLLAVLERETEARLYEPSKLDILTIGKNEFEQRRRLFDPVITDPIITGSLLSGDKTEFSELISNTVLSLSLSEKAIQFLKKKAHERLKDATTFLKIYTKKGGRDNLLSFLDELSFVCSYFEFARYYKNKHEFWPITFAHLLVEDVHPVLKEVVDFLRVVKLGRRFNKDRLTYLFQESQKLLGVVN